MFANLAAISTLIQSDPQASDEEKSSALAAVKGTPPKRGDGEVVSFRRAAEILGYRSTKGVRKALHNGILKGFYGGRKQARCTGIVRASIYSAIGRAAS